VTAVIVDLLLRRIERTAIALCGLMTAATLVVTHGRARPALAVLAGGALAAVSYLMIVSSAGAIVQTLAPQSGIDPAQSVRTSSALAVIKLTGRYALLAFIAYVMIVRLRLHPVALLAGASSLVGAVAVEAVRVFVKKS
jgi:hypothetical protein